MKQWQTDYDKAVSDRAKQILTSEQFKSYKEYQDWQAEMRNSFPVQPGGGVNGGRAGLVNFAGGTPDASISVPIISARPVETK
jgi:hypothetical protein